MRAREENSEPTAEKPEPAAPEDDGTRSLDREEFERYLSDSPSRPRDIEVLERPSFENFLSKPSTLTNHLEWQLGSNAISQGLFGACLSIIGNLNEDGYLRAVDEWTGREVPIHLEEIARTGGHTHQEVERALLLVQRFDPAGVAARNLRECLLIQLSMLDDDNPTAMQIVTDHLGSVQKNQFKVIAKALKRPIEEVVAAVDLIKMLDPRPGQKYNKPEARYVEPDVLLVKVGGEYKVLTNEDAVPRLRLNQTYRRFMDKGEKDKELRKYVKDRFDSAVQLLRNIERRKSIIVRVCQAIVRRQAAFLDRGIDFLKPMMIKDVAEEVGVDASTVSRAVANKFSYTPQGVVALRYFFSEAVDTTDGGQTSLTLVKEKVRRMIDAEDPHRPSTDERISAMLKDAGISVSRRSIAKYREDLKIPSTRERRLDMQ